MDPDRAEETVGASEFTALGEAARRRSLTALTNHGLLPFDGRPNLYVRGISGQVAAAYGNVVPDPVDADLAVLRLRTPHEERPGLFEGGRRGERHSTPGHSWTSPSDGRGPRGDCRSNCRAPWWRWRRHGRTHPTTPKTPCSPTGTD
ncbi:hypothetical protein ABZ656_25010 [Streptomyces sp. NPDC007095]|uniref:hypothetical protein n=1 Tax=Streptomyces sp. NPDC007095 TaxID=3154482 RepID=UPI0033CFF61D